MPSTVVQIQGLHYSTASPPQLMPNFPHPLRCCTTARYIPLYHLGSAILTQQLYRFKRTLRTEPSMPSPMLTNAPSQLLPLYPGQPIATFDTPRKVWILITVVHVLPKNSYQVCNANGTIYCHTTYHFQECSFRCNDADPNAPSATSEQAHIRFPRPGTQPATTIQ